MYGYASSSTGTNYGVFGTSNSVNGYGLFGNNTSGVAIYGSTSTGYGISTLASSTSGVNYAIYSQTNSSSGYAGYFNGQVYISGNINTGGDLNIGGTLTKMSGMFKIDHPLDPENKYLSHSFVESSDMMNVYNGNANLDTNGEAWIILPKWFEKLNKDFRYQLTAIGKPSPNLHIAKEISGNRFQVAGGTPGSKVSWQVTGIRHDPYAEENRVIVEEAKPVNERGTYLYPQGYGKPASKSLAYKREKQRLASVGGEVMHIKASREPATR